MSRSNAAAIRRRVTNVQNNFNTPPVTPDNIISDITPPPPIPAIQTSSLNPRQLAKSTHYTELWQKRQISNFEYIRKSKLHQRRLVPGSSASQPRLQAGQLWCDTTR